MGLAFVSEVCAKPRLCLKSKYQKKAKSLQGKSLLDSRYPKTTLLHNSAQIAVKMQLAGDGEVWSSHFYSDCSCWITQQLWNSCATKNKHDECYHRVTASAGKALEDIPACCQGDPNTVTYSASPRVRVCCTRVHILDICHSFSFSYMSSFQLSLTFVLLTLPPPSFLFSQSTPQAPFASDVFFI